MIMESDHVAILVFSSFIGDDRQQPYVLFKDDDVTDISISATTDDVITLL